MTVEEALLAVVGLVAIVLLFLGLAQALEGDPRARLRARRRLSRRAPSRAATRSRAMRMARAPRPATVETDPPGRALPPMARPAGSAAHAHAADPPAPTADAAATPADAEATPAHAPVESAGLAWREQVATHIRRREFSEARSLVDPVLAAAHLTVDDASFLLEVCSTAIARDLWRLRHALRRESGDESPLGAAMETTQLILESEPAVAVSPELRQRAGRRLWRGHTRLGLRRWRGGEFEGAVQCLFPALAVPGLDGRRRRLARDLLVRTLEDAAGESLELIPQLRGDGDRAAAVAHAQRVLEHIRRARDEGIAAEDLAVAASRARRLLEHVEPSSVQ